MITIIEYGALAYLAYFCITRFGPLLLALGESIGLLINRLRNK